MSEATVAGINQSLNCKGCGALLHFNPGTHSLKCDYCGEANPIKQEADDLVVEPVDYEEFITSIDTDKRNADVKVVVCKNCGSQTVFESFVTSDTCSFCTAPLVLDLEGGKQYVEPHYILPFAINQQQAVGFFKDWIKHLWWSPNDLVKKMTGAYSILNGVYIPHWAYDTDAVTEYTGERGTYYYTTETYTEEVDGETVTRTREVRHTNWSYASGTVECDFKDLVVPASTSITEKTLNKLTPWNFTMLEKFDERYTSGFRSETFRVSPQEGLKQALAQTVPHIEDAISNDIGGDEQRINSTDTDYQNKGIKYLMLPVWVSAYKYNDKVYQFTINASTGEVIGERPLSWIKIILAIIIGLVIIAAIILATQS